MAEANRVELEIVDQQPKELEEKEDDVKDSWDAETTEDEQDEGIRNVFISTVCMFPNIFNETIFNRR